MRPLEPKRNVFIIGSSHARRINHALKKINTKFEIHNFSKAGATFERINWPEISTIKSEDYILLQLFGNDLFDVRHVQTESKHQKRIFHLTTFEPAPKSLIEHKVQILIEKFENCPAKIYLLNLFPRHINCCKAHRDKRIVKYQYEINQLIKTKLAGTNITYLNHHQFLKIRNSKLKISRVYERIQVDSVHLYSKFYNQIASALMERVFV
jgi:hypothetical protein